MEQTNAFWTAVEEQLHDGYYTADFLNRFADENGATKDEKEKLIEEFYDVLVKSGEISHLVTTVKTAMLDSWPNINFRQMSNRQEEDFKNIVGYAITKEWGDEDFTVAVYYHSKYHDFFDYMRMKLENDNIG